MADNGLLAVLAVAGVAALALGAAAYAGGMGFMGAPMGGMMGGHGGMMGGGHDEASTPMAGQGGMGGMMGGGMGMGPAAGESPMSPGDGHGDGHCGMMEGMMGGMGMGSGMGFGAGMMSEMAGHAMELAVVYNGTATVVWADPVLGLLGLQLEDGSEVTAKLARAYVRAGDGAFVYGGWIAGVADAEGTVYVVLVGSEYRALVAEIDVAGNAYVHPMALALQAQAGH